MVTINVKEDTRTTLNILSKVSGRTVDEVIRDKFGDEIEKAGEVTESFNVREVDGQDHNTQSIEVDGEE